MPEQKKTIVFFEGDDDKAFLEKLLDAGLLPTAWQLAIRNKDQHPGKDGLIRQLIPVVSPVNGMDGRAVVLVDLDECTPLQRVEWFQSELSKELQKDQKYAAVAIQATATSGRVQGYRLVSGDRTGHVAVVPVGHCDDAPLNGLYQIDRFAIDDWIFRLALDRRVFENMSDLHGIKFDVSVKKYAEVAAVFRANGLEVRKAKTYVQILRALAAIGPSTATIVGRLVKKGFEALGKDELIALIKPLLDDLATADGLINAP
jgi:hypothetical protein